jgi:hypothetical protein
MTCLQQAYYWSQIALAVIALIAAIVAYWQLSTFKRFELLKILEALPVRKARSLLWHRWKKQPPTGDWWMNDGESELEEAASLVCASFDIVAIIARGRNWKFFTKQWSHTICWTYELLEKYIEARAAYDGYSNLYESAKKYKK